MNNRLKFRFYIAKRLLIRSGGSTGIDHRWWCGAYKWTLVVSMCFFSDYSVASQRPIKLLPIKTVTDGPILKSSEDATIRKTTGKLILKYPGDPAEHYCTGIFVKPHVVMTAAHCVQGNGTTRRYSFSGFDREGLESNRHTVADDCIRVPGKWAKLTDNYLRIAYDYAFLRVLQPFNDVPTVDLPGRSEGPPQQPMTSIGWPATLDAFTAIAAQINNDILHPSSPAFKTGSTGFTSGTSGGAWISKVNQTRLKIYSLNSSYSPGAYDNGYIRIYGPNLTLPGRSQPTEAQELLQSADRCD